MSVLCRFAWKIHFVALIVIVSVCSNVELSAFSGTITSPGYALAQEKREWHCEWTVRVPFGNRVELIFLGVVTVQNVHTNSTLCTNNLVVSCEGT